MRRYRNIEDLMWKAYIKALTPWFGVRTGRYGQPLLGRNTALFVCPPTQQGIAGGSWVPKEMTNNQIHSIADNLLSFDSPVFVPEGSSYFRALRTYMAYVKLGGDMTLDAQSRLNTTQDEYMDAQTEYDEQMIIALANIADDTENKLLFDRWALKNAPAYIGARKAMRVAEKKLLRLQQDINGRIAKIYSEDYDNLALALAKVPEPGFNMPCTTEDISVAGFLTKSETLSKPLTMEGTFYRPNYSLTGYQTLVNDWVKCWGQTPVIELNLDLKAAQEASWSDYGFDQSVVEDNVKSFPLLSTSDGEGEGTEAPEIIHFRPGSKTEIKISYRGLKLLNISSGLWDIPDVRHRYPNLCEGAPADLMGSSLAKPEKLLVGYGPSLDITFDSSTFNSAASIIQDQQNAGGKVSLFGFDITQGGEGSANAVPFENVKADGRASKLSIPAVSDTMPVLVGVLARRL